MQRQRWVGEEVEAKRNGLADAEGQFQRRVQLGQISKVGKWRPGVLGKWTPNPPIPPFSFGDLVV